ncbi:hypothetical protein BT69DRAFT_765241 [Atractiella rhizophila]|nr:hypothetical protein BT69DRAFT_765241 [Atractiella rhizophila]
MLNLKRSSYFPSLYHRLDRVQVLGRVDGDESERKIERPAGLPAAPFGHYGHKGCVNALCWSEDGQKLASGSDDKSPQASQCRVVRSILSLSMLVSNPAIAAPLSGRRA